MCVCVIRRYWNCDISPRSKGLKTLQDFTYHIITCILDFALCNLINFIEYWMKNWGEITIVSLARMSHLHRVSTCCTIDCADTGNQKNDRTLRRGIFLPFAYNKISIQNLARHPIKLLNRSKIPNKTTLQLNNTSISSGKKIFCRKWIEIR